jgi:hypothetical protein
LPLGQETPSEVPWEAHLNVLTAVFFYVSYRCLL